jgi:aminoglycoside phosphotransferase
LEHVLDWAVQSIGRSAKVLRTQRLNERGGTLLMHVKHKGRIVKAVLRFGDLDQLPELTSEYSALVLAEKHNLPAPRLLAADLEGACGAIAVLTTVLPGSSRIPRKATPDRLHALGAAAAALSRIALTPSPELPLRRRHMPWVDHSGERRYALRYHLAFESDKPSTLEKMLREMPGRHLNEAQEKLLETSTTPLLDMADKCLSEMSPPVGPTVLVHGDLWQGNTMWVGDAFVGLIDWEAAGAGHYGVDLGTLRWDAAILFGLPAAQEVLNGWEQASGQKAESVAYWDLVAGLNTPADMTSFAREIHEASRRDLDGRTIMARRDAFVRTALERLEHE